MLRRPLQDAAEAEREATRLAAIRALQAHGDLPDDEEDGAGDKPTDPATLALLKETKAQQEADAGARGTILCVCWWRCASDRYSTLFLRRACAAAEEDGGLRRRMQAGGTMLCILARIACQRQVLEPIFVFLSR